MVARRGTGRAGALGGARYLPLASPLRVTMVALRVVFWTSALLFGLAWANLVAGIAGAAGESVDAAVSYPFVTYAQQTVTSGGSFSLTCGACPVAAGRGLRLSVTSTSPTPGLLVGSVSFTYDVTVDGGTHITGTTSLGEGTVATLVTSGDYATSIDAFTITSAPVTITAETPAMPTADPSAIPNALGYASSLFADFRASVTDAVVALVATIIVVLVVLLGAMRLALRALARLMHVAR